MALKSEWKWRRSRWDGSSFVDDTDHRPVDGVRKPAELQAEPASCCIGPRVSRAKMTPVREPGMNYETTSRIAQSDVISGQGPLWRDPAIEIAADVACVRQSIVNLYLYGEPHAGDRSWVLIDAGLPFSDGQILDAASRRFGPGAARGDHPHARPLRPCRGAAAPGRPLGRAGLCP